MCKLPLIKKVRVVIGIVMCFAMTACSQGNQINNSTISGFSTVYNQKEEVYNQPNESDIAKSLADENIKGLNNTNYKITNVEISKYKIEDKGVHYWCIVTSENDDLKATAELDVLYDYYEKGGWLIENVSNYSNIHYMPKRGVTESQLLSDIKDSSAESWHRIDYNNISIISHDTDIERGLDHLVFSYTNQFYFYDEVGTVTVDYTFNESRGWISSGKNENEKQYEFHFKESNWYYAGGSMSSYYKIKPAEEDNKIYVDRYSFDNSYMSYSIYHYAYKAIIENGIIILKDFYDELAEHRGMIGYRIYENDIIMNPEEQNRRVWEMLDRDDSNHYTWNRYMEYHKFSGKEYIVKGEIEFPVQQ